MENLEEDLVCDPRYLETKISPALHGNCNSWSFQSSQKCACPLSAALFAGFRAADDSAMLILANTKNAKKKKNSGSHHCVWTWESSWGELRDPTPFSINNS